MVEHVQVCVNECNADERYCEPMQSWSLRLDTDLVKSAASADVGCCVQVCVNECNADEQYCEPMQSWSLRLDTDLVKNAQYVRKVEPGAALPGKEQLTQHRASHAQRAQPGLRARLDLLDQG